MTAPREVTRREFLATGATAGASLVIAFYLPGTTRLAAAAPFAPNAWLSIATDGIATLVLDKTEMGQGTHTGLAMILAEELEIEWTSVRLGPMPENPAAWHRRMSTGGSTGIRTSWDALRKAGAQARAMLIRAAADTWGVDPAACRAERGAVVDGRNRRLPYGRLVERAASLPVPADPPLKNPAEFRILGTRVRRLDTPAKVNGTAQFGIDVRVPGMLVASVLRSPVFGGKVKRVDAAKAKAVPGVRHVVELPGNTAPARQGVPQQTRTESAVAVVADSYWQAALGRQALEVEWDEGPNAALSSAAISATMARLAEQPGIVARKEGDAAAALAGAARKIEATYEVPYLHHMTMEPMNATAHVRPDGCDVWAPTQAQTLAQQVAADVSGLPQEKIRIHTTFLGGGFGRRLEADFVAEAVRLSQQTGAPVKVIWTREDDVQHGFYRPATYNRFSAAFDQAGRPVAWTHRIVAPSILLPKFGPLQNGIDRTSVEGAANVPYAIPNIQVEQTVADIPVPLGFWRSVGSSQNAFVTECFFDEVAHAAGRDPYELRRELLAGHPRHLKALDLVAEKAGWGRPLPAGRFRGIALAESFGSFVAEVAEVSMDDDGKARVHRVVCAVDCGPMVNLGQIEAQMEGGVVYGLSSLYQEISIEAGRVKQGNFHDYPVLRISDMPQVETYVVPSTDRQGGIGEPSVPPTAPAVCNAIFAATGKRIRKLPVGRIT